MHEYVKVHRVCRCLLVRRDTTDHLSLGIGTPQVMRSIGVPSEPLSLLRFFGPAVHYCALYPVWYGGVGHMANGLSSERSVV